jgi:DNA-binding NtrC family response regulator
MTSVDVLVVEDEEAVRTSFADILAEAGYSTAEAFDSSAALELLSNTAVGTVVLDVFLPGRSGLWLLDQLESPPPVVLVTAHHYDPEIMARRDKVFMYLQKPVNPPELLQVVARAIARGRDGSLN